MCVLEVQFCLVLRLWYLILELLVCFWEGPVIRSIYVLILILITRLTRRVPLVEQKLLTIPEHLSSPTIPSGDRVTRSLVLCVCFVDLCLSFCTFSFGHCVVCSSIYGFWLLFLIRTLCKLMWQTWTNISICYVNDRHLSCVTIHRPITQTINPGTTIVKIVWYSWFR